MMDDEDITQPRAIANEVAKRLAKDRTIDVETHRKHHQYIDSLIREGERKAERREQWLRVAGGWGIVAALSSTATALWHYLKHG